MRLDVDFSEQEEEFGGLSEEDDRLNVDFGDEITTTTANYNELTHKPSINGVVLQGDISSNRLGLIQFWFGTRAEYNALPSIDPNICYCIEEGT